MGTLIKAVCQSCDFRKRFSYGSGMMNHDTVCLVPALCPKGKFEVVNIMEELPEGYRLYNDSKLFDYPLTDQNGIQNFDIYLSPKNNVCPNCKAKMMNFEVYGNYD